LDALIIVHSCKYDGYVHRRWQGRLVQKEKSLLVLNAVFEKEINHSLLGTISPGTFSTEYFWTDRWYSIFRFCEPGGKLRNYYCNINTPPRLQHGRLSFIDLDLDILVAPDLRYQILDEDEFAINISRYKYPQDVQGHALQAVEELILMIEHRQFPFHQIEGQ